MNKSAKEMFEELGYTLEVNNKKKLRYRNFENDNLSLIEIYKKDKVVWFGNADIHYEIEITFEEFEALKKQIEELRCND